MSADLDPRDAFVAMDWLIAQVRKYSPEYARDQLARNYMLDAERIRDHYQREARA